MRRSSYDGKEQKWLLFPDLTGCSTRSNRHCRKVRTDFVYVANKDTLCNFGRHEAVNKGIDMGMVGVNFALARTFHFGMFGKVTMYGIHIFGDRLQC